MTFDVEVILKRLAFGGQAMLEEQLRFSFTNLISFDRIGIIVPIDA